MGISFTIPYPPTREGMTDWNRRYGLNAYWSGKHYKARNQDAREIHQLTQLCMRREGIRRNILDYPVEVQFYWDDRLDADNHAALGKMILDAMKGYILPDDNRRWVRKVSHEFWSGGAMRVDVMPFRDGLEPVEAKSQAPGILEGRAV